MLSCSRRCSTVSCFPKKQMVPSTAPNRSRALMVQVAVGFLANLAAISPGMNLGFSAMALPAMQSSNHTPVVTDDQASWIASLASIATPLGCLLSGSLLDRWGRRLTLFAVNVPGVIGWLLLSTAQGNSGFLTQVYIGRLLTGFSTGMASVPATVYIAEASDNLLRGMLVTWTSIFMALGILLVYLLGWCMPQDWRAVAGICTSFPLISSVVVWYLPESPVWLASKGRAKEAEQSLRRLRGLRKLDDTPGRELESLLTTRQDTSRASLSSILLPEVWKPLLIMNSFFFFQQFAGIFVVVFYAIDIAREAGVVADSYLVTVLIGVARFVVTIIISVASKRFGRRPLALVSGVGMVLCMGTLAVYLYLLQNGSVGAGYAWIPASTLVFYILISTVGFLTLPWAMIGEVFPPRVRGLASGITTCFAYLFSFAIVKVYPQMKNTFSRYGVFTFYGVVAVLGTVFVYFFLPETQGKTLQEVEAEFKKRRRENDDVIIEDMSVKPTIVRS